MEQLIWRAGSHGPEDTQPADNGSDADDEASARAPRCSHFTISQARVLITGLHREMQVPVYRCSLVEVMVARLASDPKGSRLSAVLEAVPLDGIPRLIGGPDLEAITITSCTPDRCRRSCQPGFVQILGDLGIDSAFPAE